ncbi:MAG TPA: carbon-nitrogen hydrolase family protein [Candidatus Saccharimonadales bacterium]|nr:carbon-nitrogen hydrolase family protein [Candidatus Saccharimonadales bacterium]
MSYKIGVVQAQDIQGDVSAALRVITEAMRRADNESVDILCFPECFLQGYTLDDKETKERAFDLASPQFKEMLNTLAKHKVTIILGLIEKDADGYYNTAAVIQDGKLLGTYRKIHLFERNFQPGEAYSIFTVNDLPFGINICYDARFTEGPAELAAQGAKVIFYPLNNRLLHEKATTYRDKHIPNLVARAQESGCWVVSSDVVAQDSTHIGYGCTAIVNPQGELISRVRELEPGMIAVELT